MDVLKNYMAAPVVESLARKYQDAKGGVFVDTHTILILPSLQGRAPRVICPVQNQYSVPEHLFWRGPQILIIPTRRGVIYQWVQVWSLSLRVGDLVLIEHKDLGNGLVTIRDCKPLVVHP